MKRLATIFGMFALIGSLGLGAMDQPVEKVTKLVINHSGVTIKVIFEIEHGKFAIEEEKEVQSGEIWGVSYKPGELKKIEISVPEHEYGELIKLTAPKKSYELHDIADPFGIVKNSIYGKAGVQVNPDGSIKILDCLPCK